MSNKSMIETAYDVFVKQGNSPKSLSFKELCQAVRDELGITDDEEFISKVGAFYTSLALDGRLVLLSDNTWDLRSRHTYDEIKKNTLEYYDTETADKDENGEAVDDEGLPHNLGDESDEDAPIGTNSDDDDDNTTAYIKDIDDIA